VNRNKRTVNCPRCGTPVLWGTESPFRPFCSERCKMIDLGAWASEQYRVATTGADDNTEAGSPDHGQGAP
jgi:endogenous inhibitor of DNA gyrase (YacG/DUF329 family)